MRTSSELWSRRVAPPFRHDALRSRILSSKCDDRLGPSGVVVQKGSHVENGVINDNPAVGLFRVARNLLTRDRPRSLGHFYNFYDQEWLVATPGVVPHKFRRAMGAQAGPSDSSNIPGGRQSFIAALSVVHSAMLRCHSVCTSRILARSRGRTLVALLTGELCRVPSALSRQVTILYTY